jgi:hypothetical protein
MWIYKQGTRSYLLPPKKKRKRKKREVQGSSITAKDARNDDLKMDATNHQQPWRYGQKVKKD